MRLFYEIFLKTVYFVLKFTERVIFVDSASYINPIVYLDPIWPIEVCWLLWLSSYFFLYSVLVCVSTMQRSRLHGRRCSHGCCAHRDIHRGFVFYCANGGCRVCLIVHLHSQIHLHLSTIFQSQVFWRNNLKVAEATNLLGSLDSEVQPYNKHQFIVQILFFSIPYWWVSSMVVAVAGMVAKPATRALMQTWPLCTLWHSSWLCFLLCRRLYYRGYRAHLIVHLHSQIHLHLPTYFSIAGVFMPSLQNCMKMACTSKHQQTCCQSWEQKVVVISKICFLQTMCLVMLCNRVLCNK
jgi:hypothetical protein